MLTMFEMLSMEGFTVVRDIFLTDDDISRNAGIVRIVGVADFIKQQTLFFKCRVSVNAH